MRVSALVLLFAAALSAQELSHSTAPSIQMKPDPQYTEEARRAGVEGNVVLHVSVGKDGKPTDVKVIRGVGFGVDEKAVEAVSNWQFHPATKNGEPIEVQAQIEVNFRMLQAKWHLGQAEFHLPEGATRPTVATAKAPRVADGAAKASVTVSFDINENGQPANIQSDQATDKEWAGDVIEALPNWTFTPASKDGHPVSVTCTMQFFRGN